MYRAILLASFLFCLSFHSTAAQQPTTTQRDAIRSSCRSDFIASAPVSNLAAKRHWSVWKAIATAFPHHARPPSMSWLERRRQHRPQQKHHLQPKRSHRLRPHPLHRAPTRRQLQHRKTNDWKRSVVPARSTMSPRTVPGTSPEIVLCLQANAKDLSSACKSAVTGASAPKAAITPPAEPAQSVEPAKKSQAHGKATTAATPAAPSAAQTAAIHSACRSDFTAHCSGVQPGGSAALRCLATNSVKLSPGCRTAVAAVGAIGGGAAGTSIAPSAATPAAVAPPVAPLTPRPFIMPERRLSILRICRTDVATLCGGTPPGGGRFIDCLGAHAAQLSPACYDAVARVSR